MLGKIIIKTVKGRLGRLDAETETVKKQVLELDTKKNCIFFERLVNGAS